MLTLAAASPPAPSPARPPAKTNYTMSLSSASIPAATPIKLRLGRDCVEFVATVQLQTEAPTDGTSPAPEAHDLQVTAACAANNLIKLGLLATPSSTTGPDSICIIAASQAALDALSASGSLARLGIHSSTKTAGPVSAAALALCLEQFATFHLSKRGWTGLRFAAEDDSKRTWLVRDVETQTSPVMMSDQTGRNFDCLAIDASCTRDISSPSAASEAATILWLRTFGTRTLFAIDIRMAVPAGRARQQLESTGEVDLMEHVGEDSLDPEQYAALQVPPSPPTATHTHPTHTSANLQHLTLRLEFLPQALMAPALPFLTLDGCSCVHQVACLPNLSPGVIKAVYSSVPEDIFSEGCGAKWEDEAFLRRHWQTFHGINLPARKAALIRSCNPVLRSTLIAD